MKGGGSGGGGHGRHKFKGHVAFHHRTHLETGSDGFTTPSSNAIAATAPWRMRIGQPWDEAEVRVRGGRQHVGKPFAGEGTLAQYVESLGP